MRDCEEHLLTFHITTASSVVSVGDPRRRAIEARAIAGSGKSVKQLSEASKLGLVSDCLTLRRWMKGATALVLLP